MRHLHHFIAGLAFLFVGSSCTGSITSSSPLREVDEPEPAARGDEPTPSDPAAPNETPTWEPVSCKDDKPGPRILRRLTGTQYDNTVFDLLGVQSKAGAEFVAAETVEGFANNARALTVDGLLAEQIDRAATSLAQEASKSFSALSPACPSETEACADDFITNFGKRAFRRPLTSTERARYIAAYKAERAAGGSHANGIEVVLGALLQSPGLIYRSERGTAQGATFALNAYEIASELSYLLTDSMPDAALFAAAESNRLGTSAEIEAQARRLLGTPRGRQVLSRFAQAWLQVDRLPNAPKDKTMFPAFDEAVRLSLAQGFNAFVEDVAFGNKGTFANLMTAPYTMLDRNLTKVYADSFGQPSSAAGFSRATQNVAGILSQPAVMATHAAPSHTSPVHRGRMVRERIFCQPVPPPPPNVNASLDAVDPRLPLRQRLAAHVADPKCAGCHRLLDDAGLAFEGFDAIGRRRTKEENGSPVDTSGVLFDLNNQDISVRDAEELADVAGRSAQAQGCFARQWTTYATGLGTSDADQCVLGAMLSDFPGGDGNLVELIIKTVTSAHFLRRSSI
ncbi:MAG: DUF1592 domain-containing protein [Deltaproteobacteria bacterium]|nr:DUF1592 domain-containing protein [Deltaproteobacteria bacterium]